MKRFTPQGLGDGANDETKRDPTLELHRFSPGTAETGQHTQSRATQHIKAGRWIPCSVGYSLLLFMSFVSFSYLPLLRDYFFSSFYLIPILRSISQDWTKLRTPTWRQVVGGACDHQCGPCNIDFKGILFFSFKKIKLKDCAMQKVEKWKRKKECICFFNYNLKHEI